MIKDQIDDVIFKVAQVYSTMPDGIAMSHLAFQEFIDEIKPYYVNSHRNEVIYSGVDVIKDTGLDKERIIVYIDKDTHIQDFLDFGEEAPPPVPCEHKWKVDMVGMNSGMDYESCEKCGQHRE
jgi:hypothetical protein